MNDAPITNAPNNPIKAGETSLELKPVAESDHHHQGEAEVLVSEFPPPPYYFPLASRGLLEPPAIPVEALTYASRKAAAMAAEAERAAEVERFASHSVMTAVGDHPPPLSSNTSTTTFASSSDQHSVGEVVAVFSEIVEDPMLYQVDDDCENPTVVRDRLKQLVHQALQGFVKLIRDLVNTPLDNKKSRDELSHKLFLMMREANKFREHQARELMIAMLENQLQERKACLMQLQGEIDSAKAALQQLEAIKKRGPD